MKAFGSEKFLGFFGFCPVGHGENSGFFYWVHPKKEHVFGTLPHLMVMDLHL